MNITHQLRSPSLVVRQSRVLIISPSHLRGDHTRRRFCIFCRLHCHDTYIYANQTKYLSCSVSDRVSYARSLVNRQWQHPPTGFHTRVLSKQVHVTSSDVESIFIEQGHQLHYLGHNCDSAAVITGTCTTWAAASHICEGDETLSLNKSCLC